MTGAGGMITLDKVSGLCGQVQFWGLPEEHVLPIGDEKVRPKGCLAVALRVSHRELSTSAVRHPQTSH